MTGETADGTSDRLTPSGSGDDPTGRQEYFQQSRRRPDQKDDRSPDRGGGGGGHGPGGGRPPGSDLGDEGGEGGPGARAAWFLATRLGREEKLREAMYLHASQQRHLIEREQRGTEKLPPPPAPPGGPGAVNWTPIGPSVLAHGQATSNPPVSGRITSLAVGPSGVRAYAGAANGGVWFTADGGTTWTPLDDYVVSGSTVAGAQEADSLATGAVGVRFGAAAATDLVYIGTGEPNGSGDSYFGIGIRRSAAGGAPGTWTVEATNLAGRAIYRVVIDPDSSSIVLAATTAGLFRRPAAAPFANWTKVTSAFAASNSFATDLVVAGTGPTKRYYCVFQGDAAYSSPDGTTWTPLTGLPAGGRVALAVAESDPTVVYAFKENGTLHRLVGTAFQAVTGLPPMFAIGGQGWYDLAVAVDPANVNIVYLVGDLLWDGNWTLALFKSTLSGMPGAFSYGFQAANVNNPAADPSYVGRNVHADGHAIAFALNAAGTAHDGSDVWVGTDGGVFRSTASGALGTFVSKNLGLAITEMSFFAQRSDSDALMISGCQDNGNVRYWGEPAWFEAPQGDGGGVGIDPNDQYQVMRQYAGLGQLRQNAAGVWSYSSSFYRCTDGGASGSWPILNFPPLNPGDPNQRTVFNLESSLTGFYTPIAVSPPGAPTLAAIGTHRVWLTPDWGTTWTTIPTNSNPYALAAPSSAQDALDNSPIQSIEFASGSRLFGATSNAVWRLDLAAGVWTLTPIPTAGLPAGHFITDLAVHDAAAGSFYVALGGGGLDHVWFFDGAWHSAGLTAATLDAPCHAVVVDPDHPEIVYLGSDVGVWKGTKAAGTNWSWALYSQGLPEAAVTDLAIHRRARLLRAATHGRGVWEIELDTLSGADPELYLRVNYADTGRTPGGTRFPWVEGAQDPTRKGFNVFHWKSPDIKVRRPSLPTPVLSTPPDMLDFAVNIGDYVDTTNTETADQSGINRIFIQVHNRALTPLVGTDVRVLLLLTDAAAGLPALPADYATRIISGDATNWVSGTPWRFADPLTPYRTLPNAVHARQSQVVFYDFDFSTLALPAGHNHVCAAAFVTTISASDRLQNPGNTSLDALTMVDRHVAHRNIHLVAAGAMPTAPGASTYRHEPETVVLDFYNVDRDDAEIEILVDRSHFPGRLSMLLPKLELKGGEKNLRGWSVRQYAGGEMDLADHVGGFLERLGEAVEELGEEIELAAARLRGLPAVRDDREILLKKLGRLDRTRVYVADDDAEILSLTGLALPSGGHATAAITFRVPPTARPGDEFEFDVIQRRGKRVVGGSTYVVAVFDQAKSDRGQ
jgi:hypothetical protein